MVPPVLLLVKLMFAVDALWQTVWPPGWLTWPDGFTVMMNDLELPVQVTPPLVVTVVTVMVAVTGLFVEFKALKGRMLPVPLAASPMEVFVLVQLKNVPFTSPENATASDPLLQTTWSGMTFTVGIGFTVMLKSFVAPGHRFMVGVTV